MEEENMESRNKYLNELKNFSKGSQLNIKITNQDDLDLFEAFCIMKEQKRK